MHTDEPLLQSYPSHLGAAVCVDKKGRGKFKSLPEGDGGSVQFKLPLISSLPFLFPHCMSRPAKEMFAFIGAQLNGFH